MDFLIAGTAAVGAGFFTNPLDVVKTRMQLQGELHKKGQYTRHYKNIVHAAYNMIKHDGILSLQKGLVSALCVQFILNGTRLGFFQFGENRGFITDTSGNLIFYRSVILGGIAGVSGQFLCSPFFLVKTHIQLQAANAIAVGHQHNHKDTLTAFAEIFKKNGITGIFRGAAASLPRTFIGSITQLTTFKFTKEYLCNKSNYFCDNPLLTSFSGSMVAGAAISVTSTPPDLVMIRLYNQPVDSRGKGLIYRGYFDCVQKIYKSEGVAAFYKGIGPMYLRLGPHSVLCLVFWDQLQDLYKKY